MTVRSLVAHGFTFAVVLGPLALARFRLGGGLECVGSCSVAGLDSIVVSLVLLTLSVIVVAKLATMWRRSA